jgi:indolepyruvate ferredoxin oxidoreductase, beta subunit
MMNDKIKNILLVGVGGQGTILVGKILSTGLLQAGYDVKMSEVHGMSQRGGSVSNQVRYGKKVFSPVMGKGEADILISFEQMETWRWMDYLKPGGKVVINDYRIPSAPILSGKTDYPEGITEKISVAADTLVIRAADIAEKVGNSRTMNMVLFGALVESMPLNEIDWETIIRENIKPGLVDMNLTAFRAGKEAGANVEPVLKSIK